MAPAGLNSLESRHGPAETARRLETGTTTRGLTLFASIDHAAGSAKVGSQLHPTFELIGRAKAGTPLMQMDQRLEIDLPLRALVWLDGDERTWISYNQPVWLVAQHSLPAQAQELASKMRKGIDAVVREAAERDSWQCTHPQARTGGSS